MKKNSKKVSIAITIDSLGGGGAERSLISLLSNIDKNKYCVTLITFTENNILEKYIPSYVKLKYVKFDLTLQDRMVFYAKRKLKIGYHPSQLLWDIIKDKLKAFEDVTYDVAISWGQGFSTYFSINKIKAKKFIAWVNIDFPLAGYNLEKDRAIYESCDVIVGVSEFVKESMITYLKSENVTFINNIIDIDDVIDKSKLELELPYDERFNILSAGRLVHQKNFVLAIESAARLKDRGLDFCWYIIGEGILRNQLQNEIKKRKLEKYVRLLGYKENPYPYIKNCDIYCQTSIFEGLGRVLIEASHLNRPVVTTNFPSAYSIIKDGETGIICEMNKESVSFELEKLIKDRDLYNNILKKLNESTFDHKAKTISDFDKLIENVVNEN